MRFLPVSKLDQIFRSSFSHLWGRKTGSNVVVEGQRRYKSNTPRHHHHHRRRHHDHCHGRVYFSLVPEIIVAISEAGLWRGFSVTSCQKLIGTASWAGAGAGGGAGAGAGVEQRVWQECSVSLLQIWKAWRLKELDGVYREMRDFSYRKCQSGVYWRPAVFVSLADKKGQMLLHSLAMLVGGAFFHQNEKPVLAEQLHGSWELTSQTHDTTLKSVYKETVEAVLLWVRAFYLLALFTPCLLVGAFVDKDGGRLRTFWMHLLLRSLEAAGPAFIKWGQWASTRPDIFPADICEELSKLHMQAPKHSYAETRKIMQKAFRVPIEDIFDDFEEEPVASGSIAQIHRAVLKNPPNNGPPCIVAVKVRHPRVNELIQRDFCIIKLLARYSTRIPGLQHLQLDKSVQHFASFMTRQVDLTLEAAHLQRFIYNFRNSKDVTFPVPIYPLVHPTVLVETFEEGQTVANFVDTGPLTKVHARLAQIGSSCLLKMMLQDNFIHGDLHPGNIFVRFVGKEPKVILLDVGMTAELNAQSRAVMLELFKAVASKNGRDVATWTLQFTDDQSCPDPEAFKTDVDAKFKEYLSVRGTAKNTGECMTELFDQIRKHRVNMDGDVCTVMVTTLILEGWQRKLDPDLDLFKMLGDLLLKAEWAVSFEYTMSAIAAP